MRGRWAMALAACSCATQTPPSAVTEPAPVIVYVATSATVGDGSRERPFGGIDEALQANPDIVRLGPGVHEGSLELLISRSVRMEGADDAGGSRIAGYLVVSGAALDLSRVRVLGGVAIRSGELRARSSTISAGPRDDALSGFRARIELERSVVLGGAASALTAVTSTVVLDRVRLEADGSRRGFLARDSSVRARSVVFAGSTLAQAALQASQVSMDGVSMSGGREHGLVATDTSSVAARDVRVRTGGIGVLVQSSSVSLRRAEIEAAGAFALSGTGAQVVVVDSALSGGTNAVVSHDGGRLTVRRSSLRAGEGALMWVGAGRARWSDVEARAGPRDGIVVSGPNAGVEVERSEIRGAGSFAVVSDGGASLSVRSSTVTNCGGGVSVRDGWMHETRIESVCLEGCQGPGLLFTGARGRARDLRADDCSLEAADYGVLRIDGAKLSGTSVLRAYGRATVESHHSSGSVEPVDGVCLTDGHIVTSTAARLIGCLGHPDRD